MRKILYRERAKTIEDKDIRGIVVDITRGNLISKCCVISRMVKVIDIKQRTLHKRIQRFDKYSDEGMIDINYHKIGLEIAKKGYRACRFIFIIVDYTYIYGAFGVGVVKG